MNLGAIVGMVFVAMSIVECSMDRTDSAFKALVIAVLFLIWGSINDILSEIRKTKQTIKASLDLLGAIGKMRQSNDNKDKEVVIPDDSCESKQSPMP